MVRYRYNSADNHLNTQWLPRNMWQARVATPFRELAPRVVETPTGSYWCWEGKQRGMAADFSWNASAQQYVELYRRAIELHQKSR